MSTVVPLSRISGWFMSDMGCYRCIVKLRCGVFRIHREMSGTTGIGERVVSPGEELVAIGAAVPQLMVVKVGSLLLRHEATSQGGRAVAVVGQGVMLGVGALLDQVAHAEVKVCTPSRICTLNVTDVRSELLRRPAVGLEVARAAMRLSEWLLQWAAVARSPEATQRVGAVMRLLTVAQGGRVLDLPDRNDMAELCCCAPETVSRSLRELGREGLVRKLQRNRIEWLGHH